MVNNLKDKEIIIDLFFNHFYKLHQIIEFFGNKYCEAEIKTIIKEHI